MWLIFGRLGRTLDTTFILHKSFAIEPLIYNHTQNYRVLLNNIYSIDEVNGEGSGGISPGDPDHLWGNDPKYSLHNIYPWNSNPDHGF
jgi:hypothetical protein